MSEFKVGDSVVVNDNCEWKDWRGAEGMVIRVARESKPCMFWVEHHSGPGGTFYYKADELDLFEEEEGCSAECSGMVDLVINGFVERIIECGPPDDTIVDLCHVAKIVFETIPLDELIKYPEAAEGRITMGDLFAVFCDEVKKEWSRVRGRRMLEARRQREGGV